MSLMDYANGTLQGDAFTQLGDSERGAKELIVDCCARHILAQVLMCVPLYLPLVCVPLYLPLVCIPLYARMTGEVTELTKLK